MKNTYLFYYIPYKTKIVLHNNVIPVLLITIIKNHQKYDMVITLYIPRCAAKIVY